MVYKYLFPGFILLLIVLIDSSLFLFYHQTAKVTCQKYFEHSINFSQKVKIPQFKSEWQQRTEKVRDYCSNHKLIIPKPPELSDQSIPQTERDQIQTDYEDWLTFNIVHITGLAMNWCMVPKVASSSVSELILPYLRELNIKFPFPQLEVWTRAGRLAHSDFVQQLQAGSPAFLITRHPFARIVSAYKNKIENRTKFRDGNEFYNNWSRQIIKWVCRHVTNVN